MLLPQEWPEVWWKNVPFTSFTGICFEEWKLGAFKLMLVTTWLYQILIIVLLGLLCFFLTYPPSPVLKTNTPMNEANFPTANISRCLTSSTSAWQGIMEPLSNTFPKAKCITPLYFPVQMMQTNVKKPSEGKKQKNHHPTLHDKIWKCYDIQPGSQTTQYDKILLQRISKYPLLFQAPRFQWLFCKLFRLPFLKRIRFLLISEKQNSGTQFIMYLTNKTQELIIPGS